MFLIWKELQSLKLSLIWDTTLLKYFHLLTLWLMILHQPIFPLMVGLFQLTQKSYNPLITDMEVFSLHHKLLLVLKLVNKLQEVFILVTKELCV